MHTWGCMDGTAQMLSGLLVTCREIPAWVSVGQVVWSHWCLSSLPTPLNPERWEGWQWHPLCAPVWDWWVWAPWVGSVTWAAHQRRIPAECKHIHANSLLRYVDYNYMYCVVAEGSTGSLPDQSSGVVSSRVSWVWVWVVVMTLVPMSKALLP